MQINDFRKKFDDLPPVIKNLLLSPKLSDIIIDINDRHNLTLEQSSALAQTLWRIFIKELSIIELTNIISSKLKLDPEKAKALTLSICKEILIPIRRYLPGIEVLIQNLGGKLPETTPIAPQPKNENIVDLKNLNRE